jgi:hypothetical protein
MKPKVNTINGQKVEVIIDKTTGEQIIRIVKEKPSEKCKIKSFFSFYYVDFI